MTFFANQYTSYHTLCLEVFEWDVPTLGSGCGPSIFSEQTRDCPWDQTRLLEWFCGLEAHASHGAFFRSSLINTIWFPFLGPSRHTLNNTTWGPCELLNRHAHKRKTLYTVRCKHHESSRIDFCVSLDVDREECKS